jgi:hypothetical protein
MQLPTVLESVGFIFGIFGALVLSIPDQFRKIFGKKEDNSRIKI